MPEREFRERYVRNERGRSARKYYTDSSYDAFDYLSYGSSRYYGPQCTRIPPEHEVVMKKVDGMYYCGTKGGKAFVDAERVDSKTKQCKAGYTACSDNTSAENTICTKGGKDECPITAMKFVSKSEVDQYRN